jgi:hypothetical protein
LTFHINEKNHPNGQKIGTYGLIKHPQAFVGGVSVNEQKSLIDFGYVFEMMILKLTELDFDTCWLGGTFKRKDYRRKLADNEIIPAVSPVGFAAKKRSLIDRFFRKQAQSSTRKDNHELFFNYSDGEPFDMVNGNQFITPLTFVRRAPSASNKQPWRLFIDKKEGHIHVGLARTTGYAKMLSYDIQSLDIGIAISHLEIGLEEIDEKYTKKILKNITLPNDAEYIITYQISKS